MNSPSHSIWLKAAIVVALIAMAGGLYAWLGDALTLDFLASREAALRDYLQQRPAFVYGVAFAIYVAVTGLSLPGAAVLTLACGWFFGLLPGILLASFASTSGATIAFLVSRFLLRESIVARFGDRLTKFNRALEKEGAFYLFLLRLVPAVPFFVINAVMGLTPIKPRTFWWVSQLGMLPGTVVYVYAGATVPSLQQLAADGVSGLLSFELLIAFTLLGVFPLLVRRVVQHFRPLPSATA